MIRTNTNDIGESIEMDKLIYVYNNRTKIAEQIIFLCKQEEIAVSVAETIERLHEMLEERTPHLLLVDVEFGSKGWDKGIRLIAGLRAKNKVPLIVVSEQSAETAMICALESGADDYVAADCNPLVLLARIKSQIRRYAEMTDAQEQAAGVYRVQGLVLDDKHRAVTVEGRDVRLTPIEYKILRFLVQERGKVFTPDQICENVWRERAACEDRTIMVHICHIRKKIEDDPRQPKYLKAVWGYGYKVG